MTTTEKVEERLDDLGYDASLYDIETMSGDIDNGNFDLDEATDFHDYSKRQIVINSITNGQIRQAKDQAAQYDLNYELIEYQINNGEW